MLKLSDFTYALPKEYIARYPLKDRSASRLFCLEGNTGVITHAHFRDLLSLIRSNDLIIFNNSRVIPARLRGKKSTGGQVEMLVERILDTHRVLAHLRASKTPQPDSLLFFSNDIVFRVIKRQGDLFELVCEEKKSVLEIIESIGEIPLPPYFERPPEKDDIERYQTIYATEKGSVAAPTAGLHFDEMMLEALQKKGVKTAYLTLHVGAGTFSPVRVENIMEHHMHPEYIDVPESLCETIRETKRHGGRIIAVGTTTARSLETACLSGKIQPFLGDTQIFIYPGFTFHCVDVLITNFHLPQSTLLMLVAAFGGYENVMRAYREAVDQQYRFFSYGDAMWVSKNLR